MSRYLAKSGGETIIQHTKELLDEWKLLKELYPNALNSKKWRLLRDACKYHDLGKMNLKFQTKLNDNHSVEPGEIPHALLSITLLPTTELLNKGFSEDQVAALAYAIALHHDRNLDEISIDEYEKEIHALQKQVAKFPFKKLGLKPTKPRRLSSIYYSWNYYPGVEDEYYRDFVLLKGLLNRLDYAASGHYQVESGPRIRVDKNIIKRWRENDPKAKWNSLQAWTGQHSHKSIVVIGQTGLGKTECALRWIGDNKGFFLLPLKSAINSIYSRLSENYGLDNRYLTLLHSDMMAFLLKRRNDFTEVERQITESQALSKQLTIATLDQLFNFVYHYRGYEAKLVTLSYSKIVIDEIQMYSPMLLAYIIYGLKIIQDYGGKFEIMTATLAPFILDLMHKQGLKFTQPKEPFFDDKLKVRHSVKVINQPISSETILKACCNNKVLVICNTVHQAENIYDDLSKKVDNVHLIHSRFIRKDRVKLEKEICQFGQLNNTEPGIWIGTQVVEASLDIDFDVLFTELSELNGLFQRMGRCYRKREFDGSEGTYNVFVFDGGNYNPSGISDSDESVVDYGMYRLAKKALENVNGPLSEMQKIDLVNYFYTTEKIERESANYLAIVTDTIKFLKAIADDHIDKKRVKRDFRNIESIDVIPEQVLMDNKDKIKSAVEIIGSKDSDKSQKVIAKNTIQSYTVAVPLWMAKEIISNSELENIGFRVLGKNYPYDAKRGLSSKLDDDKDIDNVF